MTEKDYLSMLKDFRYSPVSKLGQDLGINIIVSPQKMRAWAKNAYESGTGLRGVKNHLLEEVDKALFNNPNVKEINIR
jgi:ATP-dependent protease Clp ATPase subunit